MFDLLPRACQSIFISLCALSLSLSSTVAGAQVQQAAPTPTPAKPAGARRALPKLSSGSRGFEQSVGRDASSRFIAIGGGRGGGGDDEPIRLPKRKTARAYNELGIEYYTGVQYAKAISAYEQAIRLQPNYAAPHFNLGLLYYEYYEEIETYDSEGFYNQDLLAAFRVSSVDELNRKAVKALREAIRLNPSYARSYSYLGSVYYLMGRYREAIEFFNKWRRMPHEDILNEDVQYISFDDLYNVQFYLGVAYMELGQYEEAVKAFRASDSVGIQVFGTGGLEYYLGLAYSKLGQTQKAIEAYQEALRKKSDYLEAHYNLGVLYGTSGDYARAIDAFMHAIHLKPTWAAARYNLGVAYERSGRRAEAIEAFKKAIGLDPDYSAAYLELGLAYAALGDMNAAQEQQKKLQTLSPDLGSELSAAINKQAQNLSSTSNSPNPSELQHTLPPLLPGAAGVTEDFAEFLNWSVYGVTFNVFIDSALRTLRDASPGKPSKTKPVGAREFYMLGLDYLLGEEVEDVVPPGSEEEKLKYRLDRALQAFTQAIRLKPEFAEAYFGLALADSALARPREALEAFKQAIRLKPNYAPAYFGLGTMYEALEQHAEAIETMKQAVRLAGNENAPSFALADMYIDMGKYLEAAEAYRQGLRANRYNENAFFNLGNLYARLGQYEEAIVAYRRSATHSAAYNIGLAYSKLNRHREAAESFKEVIQENQGVADEPQNQGAADDQLDFMASFKLGVAYGTLTLYEEAAEAFTEAARLNPNIAETHYNLGLVNLALGKRDAALEQQRILQPLDANLANKLLSEINK